MLRQKEEELWKLKYFSPSKNIIFPKKNGPPLNETKNPL
jgi:hypothetical protein